MSDAATVATLVVYIAFFILSFVVLALLVGVLTFGCVILYRKVSRKWIHSNEDDLWIKLEPTIEDEIKEIEEQIKELDKGKEEPTLPK